MKGAGASKGVSSPRGSDSKVTGETESAVGLKNSTTLPFYEY